jgi:hypothetical protein
MKGHSPKNLESTKLFTSTVLIKVNKYGVIAVQYYEWWKSLKYGVHRVRSQGSVFKEAPNPLKEAKDKDLGVTQLKH